VMSLVNVFVEDLGEPEHNRFQHAKEAVEE
jgi:hypothetical protein